MKESWRLQAMAVLLPGTQKWIVYFSYMLACLGCTLSILAVEVPLDSAKGMVETKGKVFARWEMSAGDSALASGFTTLAAQYYREVLAEGGLELNIHAEVVLNLASSLIADGLYDEADRALDYFAGQKDLGVSVKSRYLLNEAIVAYNQGDFFRMDAALSLKPEHLRKSDRAWYFLLMGLQHERAKEMGKRDEAFKRARELAVTKVQKTQFELALFRSQLMMNEKPSGDDLLELKAKLTASERGKEAAFQYTKLYAIMLNKLGKSEEAIVAIEEQLQYLGVEEGDFRDQFHLIIALIDGIGGSKGRAALEEMLRRGGKRELQMIALRLLAQAAEQSGDHIGLTVLLDELIAKAESSVAENRLQHPLLDEIYFMRAEQYVKSGAFEQAEEMLTTKLLTLFPTSALSSNGIYMLSYIAWKRNPPQYRTIAGYLNQLRAKISGDYKRARLAALVADCFFLNGDYENAVAAYGVAADEIRSSGHAQEIGRLLFQQVNSLIETEQLDQAVELLDAKIGAENYGIYQWRAEWNLVNNLKLRGESDRAINRLNRLIRESEKQAIPSELLLRLMWLEAELSFEKQQFTEIPRRAERIFLTLDKISDEIIGKELREQLMSRTLLLSGQSYFAKDNDKNGEESGLRVFEKLRTDYPESEPAIKSYFVEGLRYMATDRLVDAQKVFQTLADRYESSKYAPVALYKAAICAQKRGIEATTHGPQGILDAIQTKYPEDELIFYVRLTQADIFRELNKFSEALLIYEDLIKIYPEHKELFLAEIALADCLLAMAGQDADKLESAIAKYERLAENADHPIDLRTEAGYKWGFTVAQKNESQRAKEVYYKVIDQFLLNHDKQKEALGPKGRFWISRSIFGRASLLVKEKEFSLALIEYRRILDFGLPGQAIASAEIKEFEMPREN